MINDDILGIPQIQVWAAAGGFLVVERVPTDNGWCLSRKIAVTAEEVGAMVAHILTMQTEEASQEFEDDFKGDPLPTE